MRAQRIDEDVLADTTDGRHEIRAELARVSDRYEGCADNEGAKQSFTSLVDEGNGQGPERCQSDESDDRAADDSHDCLLALIPYLSAPGFPA